MFYGFDAGKNKAEVIPKGDIKWFTIRLSGTVSNLVRTYVEDFSLSSLVIGIKKQPSSMYLTGDVNGAATGVVCVDYDPDTQAGTNVNVEVTNDVVVAAESSEQVFHIYYINV